MNVLKVAVSCVTAPSAQRIDFFAFWLREELVGTQLLTRSAPYCSLYYSLSVRSRGKVQEAVFLGVKNFRFAEDAGRMC